MIKVNYYIGAYAEVKSSKTIVKGSEWVVCDKKHKRYVSRNDFCDQCGGKMHGMEDTYNYPTMIDDLVEYMEPWEDVLGNSTPEYLYNSGVMILVPNADDGGWWESLEHDDYKAKIRAMPTGKEVKELKVKFEAVYNDILTEIKKSKHVIDVTVKFGLVPHYEY